MTAVELLAYLHRRRVRVSIRGNGRLHCDAPKGVMTSSLRQELAEHKAEIAALLSQEGAVPKKTPPALVPLPRVGGLPLSFSQEGLWFAHRMDPESPAYNIPMAARVNGPLNIDALEQAVNEMVRRHEVFRAICEDVDGQPRQFIVPILSVKLPVVDLRALKRAEQEAELMKLAIAEARAPFDFARGPLLRGSLLYLGSEEYVLLLTTHHLVADGWSMQIFYRELSALYQAFANGMPSPLTPVPLQYADFASWQRQWLQGEELKKQLAYWKDELAGAASLLELPTDRLRPTYQSYRGSSVHFALPSTLSESLRTLSRAEGVTLFMTLLTAFQTLLYRYSGQDDIIVGVPVSNRNLTDVEGLIGPFANSLSIRVSFSDLTTFREILGRVRSAAVGAFAHQDLPFEKLISELQPQRSTSHTPIFQVMFVLHRVEAGDLKLADLSLSRIDVEQGTVMFDLVLGMQDAGKELCGYLNYSTDLFEAGTIRRMIRHFHQLLEGIVTDPNKLVSQLSLMTDAECQELLVEWNQTQTDYSRQATIHALFEQQVAKAPEAVAVVLGEKVLSYGELNAQANQLAHYLRARGVGPEVMVGICVERSLEMVVGLLGILKAGGVYLPLDPNYPSQRIALMLEDSQAPLLLTLSSMLSRLPDFTREVICLDRDWAAVAQEDRENPVSGATADNLAYVIYTSGSSGEPKGVEVCHRGLSNLVFWHCRAYLVRSADRATHMAGLGFDASVWELWPYLVAGASVYLVSIEQQSSPASLWEWMAARGITLSFLATPLAEAVLREPLPEGLQLRALLTGGDRLHAGLRDKPLPFRLINHYGPTENTVVATCTEVDVLSDEEPAIGRPIDNVQTYILDQHMQPVPVGVPGELYIGGDSLARGYLNRPELTAEKFMADPFDTSGEGRLYRTGDRVRYRDDSTIEFLGRYDHQVKIRGFRIELGEIESVLARHESVQEAVVLAREDDPGEKRLVAYVMPTEGAPLVTSELKDYLQKTLPQYMVPSAFVELEALPMTPNGKIDRKALPAPIRTVDKWPEKAAAPRGELEIVMANIWSELLDIDDIQGYDTFYDLGGHSLLSIEVVARFERETGLHLSPAILINQTLRQIVAEIDTNGAPAITSAPGKGSRGLLETIKTKLSKMISKHTND